MTKTTIVQVNAVDNQSLIAAWEKFEHAPRASPHMHFQYTNHENKVLHLCVKNCDEFFANDDTRVYMQLFVPISNTTNSSSSSNSSNSLNFKTNPTHIAEHVIVPEYQPTCKCCQQDPWKNTHVDRMALSSRKVVYNLFQEFDKAGTDALFKACDKSVRRHDESLTVDKFNLLDCTVVVNEMPYDLNDTRHLIFKADGVSLRRVNANTPIWHMDWTIDKICNPIDEQAAKKKARKKVKRQHQKEKKRNSVLQNLAKQDSKSNSSSQDAKELTTIQNTTIQFKKDSHPPGQDEPLKPIDVDNLCPTVHVSDLQNLNCSNVKNINAIMSVSRIEIHCPVEGCSNINCKIH
jgi:hypothetical protein